MVKVLFFVATIQLFLGALYGWFYRSSLEYSYWQGWIFVFSAPVYLTLGFAARWLKCYSLLIGFALYLYLAFTVHALPYAGLGVWQDGLVLKLPILTFLLWGLLVGNDRHKPRRKLELLVVTILIVGCGFGVQFAIREIIGLHDWIGGMQDSLKGAAEIVPTQSMPRIVDIFCEANSKLFRMLIIAGCGLGICSFGLFLILIKLIVMQTKKIPRQ